MTQNKAPWFGLVAGVNGAGKSTFSQTPATLADLIRLSNASEIEVINPDTVTRAILKQHPTLEADVANKMAADQVETIVRKRIEEREGSFVVETVLASDKYKSIVDRAQQLGWNFLFVYVALPSINEALRRVAERVSKGGHPVPEAKIRKRWPISLTNMPWFWVRAESSYLFLNPPSEPKLLAFRQEGCTTILFPNECQHAIQPLLEATADERVP